MKRPELLFLILINLVSGFARAQPNGDYLKFGLGYSFQRVLDQSLSPVSYSGHFGQINLGYYSQNEKWISELDISVCGGIQKADVNREVSNRQTLSGLTRLRYTLVRNWGSIGHWRFYAGLSSINSFDFRNHNNYVNSQSNYTAVFALGPSATVQREFRLFNRDWGAQFAADLPVAAYYLRPGYVKPFFGDQVGSKGLVGWGKYFAVSTRSDLIFYLSNDNQLRLVYDWAYMGLAPLNKVQTGTHQISLCALLRF